MPTQKRTPLNRRASGAVAVTLAVVLGLAAVQAIGCSNASSTGDPSAEGGSGGSGGKSAEGGTSGSGGAKTYDCGSDTCTVGDSYCYTYYPGSTGGQPGHSCQPTPAACTSTPTSCACLCPPSDPGGCVPVGPIGPLHCSCSDTGGVANVTCGGE